MHDSLVTVHLPVDLNQWNFETIILNLSYWLVWRQSQPTEHWSLILDWSYWTVWRERSLINIERCISKVNTLTYKWNDAEHTYIWTNVKIVLSECGVLCEDCWINSNGLKECSVMHGSSVGIHLFVGLNRWNFKTFILNLSHWIVWRRSKPTKFSSLLLDLILLNFLNVWKDKLIS